MFYTKNKKANPWGNDSPEKLKESSGIAEGIKNQVAGLVDPGSVAEMIFGTPKNPEFKHDSKEAGPKLPRRQEFLVFKRTQTEGEKTINKETSAVLQELKKQIVRLEKSQKNLSGEIAKVKVDQIPAKSGIYYLRYFEWLIGVIQQLVMRVEEGKAWLQTFNSRKQKKMGYWQKAKKHGTSFSMSKERTMATQSG